jgi:hypothetical protein
MSSASRKSKRPFKPVIVTWNDAWESQEDATPEEIKHEPVVQNTIGFLIRDNKKGITLATEYADDGSGLRTTNFIPRGMVVKVKRLR